MHGEQAPERRRVHPIVPCTTSVLLPGDGRSVGSWEWVSPPFSICIDTSNAEPFKDLKPFSKIKKHDIPALVDAARALELLSVTSDESPPLKEFPKILVLPLPHSRREDFFPQRIQKILKTFGPHLLQLTVQSDIPCYYYERIQTYAKNLQTVSLCGLEGITLYKLQELLSSLESLTELRLRRIRSISTESDMVGVLDSIKSFKMRKVSLPHWDVVVGNRVIKIIAHSMPLLNVLDITQSNVTHEAVEYLQKLTEMRSLCVRACRLTRPQLISLCASLPKLEDIDVGSCPGIDDNFLIVLSRLTKNGRIFSLLDVSRSSSLAVNEVDFSMDRSAIPLSWFGDAAMQVTHTGLRTFLEHNFTHLRSLRLRRCLGISSQGMIDCVPYLANLSDLCVDGNPQFSENVFAAIAIGCKKLVSLSVAHCPGVSNAMLALLQDCSSLCSLDISFCTRVTDVGMRFLLPGKPSLLTLRCRQCNELSDVVPCLIARNQPQIMEVDLSFTRIQHIDSLERMLAVCQRLDCIHLEGLPARASADFAVFNLRWERSVSITGALSRAFR